MQSLRWSFVPAPDGSTSSRPAARRAPKHRAATMVLLVRHGTTPTTGVKLPGRAPGLHLSDRGHAQAAAAAQRIAALSKVPTAVYASPLERTRETAAPIARALGLRVRNAPDLIEVDVGEWREKRLKRVTRSPQWRWVHRWRGGFGSPGGESSAEMSGRPMERVP